MAGQETFFNVGNDEKVLLSQEENSQRNCVSQQRPAVYAVVTAAGSGARLGRDKPKALVELNTEALVCHALRNIFNADNIAHVVVTVPQGYEQVFRENVSACPQLSQYASSISFVAGGRSRQSSVSKALQFLRELDDRIDSADTVDSALVLIHDAARCLTPPSLINSLVENYCRELPARRGDAAFGVIPVLPVTDSLKYIDQKQSYPVDRSHIFAVQTPQLFDLHQIADLHLRYGDVADDEATAFTDDASMLVADAGVIKHIQGDSLAFKITTEFDLVYAQAVLNYFK